jgi:hypothetical protein
MDGFTKQVFERLPLADGVLSLLSWVFEPEFLNRVFDEFRGRSYESELTFSTMVSLIQDALLEHRGSGHQAMVRARNRDELEVSIQAVYGKLRRAPIGLSLGFLARSSDRLREAFPAGTRTTLAASLKAFDVYAVDGKKIKRVAKRLKPARQFSGSPLGGKVLAALDLRRGLIVAINADPDGETNDAPLIPGLLPQVRERSPRRVLWIADRQFCDLIQPRRFAENNGAFLIRYHPKNSFHRDPDLPVNEGLDSQGQRYREEWGYLGTKRNKRRLYVRRITMFREDGEDVILVTNLLDAQQYPATDLLNAYLLRWGIERVFQQVTEVFHLQSLISSSPEGTIFQFAFCALLYNLVQVVRAYISRAQRKPAGKLSSELLFYDVQRELVAMSMLANRESIIEYFQPAATARELTAQLDQLFADVWEEHWVKSPKKRIPKSTVKKKPINGGHTSIFRIMQEAKRQTQ